MVHTLRRRVQIMQADEIFFFNLYEPYGDEAS